MANSHSEALSEPVTNNNKASFSGYMMYDSSDKMAANPDPMHEPFTHVMDSNASVELSNGTLNGTNELSALVSLTYPSMPAMVIVGTLLIGLAFATAFGNFLVLLALLKYRNLRSLSNYLIGNLACSDFLLAMTILPLSAVQECLGHWVFGEIMCYFWLCTDVLYCTASIWNLCVIAFVRFTATLYPVWYREHQSAAKQAAIYISIVWVFSIAICIPPLLGWNDLSGSFVYDNKTNVQQCLLFTTKSYVVYSASGSFYIPFILTLFLYIRIFGVLYSRMNKMKVASRAKKAMQERLAIPTPPTVNPITVEATNPLCSDKGDIEMTVQTPVSPPQTRTDKTQNENADTQTQKPLLCGTDSDEEDDSACSKHPNKNGDPPQGNGHEHKQNGQKGDKSKTMVVFHPQTNFAQDSDKDDVKIVVCAENGKNNNQPTTTGTKHNISSLLKPKKLFSRNEEKKKKDKVHKRHDQREMRATIRMAIIIACFCGCWFGFFTSYLIRGIIGEENFHMPRGLEAFFFWLGYSNSAMNPILYTIFNDDFRRAFQKILGCHTNDRHGAGPAYGKTRS